LTEQINPGADDSRRPGEQAVRMTFSDYLLGFGAMAIVLWGMRRHELTDRSLRRPLIIAAVVCVAFLPAIPTAGADVALVAAGVLTGIACGAVGGLATRVERDGPGAVIATGTPLAVAVTGGAFAARLAFAVAATNGLGPAIGRASQALGITSAQAWVAALVLMAVCDLTVRALVLWQRRAAVRASAYAGMTGLARGVLAP
jgi:hypothetical protein